MPQNCVTAVAVPGGGNHPVGNHAGLLFAQGHVTAMVIPNGLKIMLCFRQTVKYMVILVVGVVKDPRLSGIHAYREIAGFSARPAVDILVIRPELIAQSKRGDRFRVLHRQKGDTGTELAFIQIGYCGIPASR